MTDTTGTQEGSVDGGARAHRHHKRDVKIDLVRSVSVALAAVSVAATVTALFSEKTQIDILGAGQVAASRAELDARLVRITGNLQKEVQALQRDQDNLTQLPKDDRIAIRLAQITTRMDAISARQTKLEEAIQRSPDEALTMPLMKRDIENIKEGNQQSITMIKASVDQIYDLTKWLLGALTLGVLSLVLTTFFPKRGANGE